MVIHLQDPNSGGQTTPNVGRYERYVCLSPCEQSTDALGAAEIELDVEVIIQALKTFGQRYNIAGAQALRAERYRKSTVDEVRFMEREDVEEGL